MDEARREMRRVKVNLGTIKQPAIVVDQTKKILVWYLPGLLSKGLQARIPFESCYILQNKTFFMVTPRRTSCQQIIDLPPFFLVVSRTTRDVKVGAPNLAISHSNLEGCSPQDRKVSRLVGCLKGGGMVTLNHLFPSGIIGCKALWLG